MGRSNGYRPTNANRAEVNALRARLRSTPGDEWRKAGMIMQQITAILGHRGGPMGGTIKPRACSYCDFYGHTRQWCPNRPTDARGDAEVRAHRAWYEKMIAKADPKWREWHAWADRRYTSLREAGYDGCSAERADYAKGACMVCKGCRAWDTARKRWERDNPQPHTSETGA